MVIVSAESLSKQYNDRRLFADITFGIEAGARIGFLGVNGSGKTTLLRIVAGTEQPDNGRLTYKTGTRVAYLPQEPTMDPAITIDEYMLRGDSARQLLRREYDGLAAHLRDHPADAAAIERLSELAVQLDAAGAWDGANEIQTILTRLGIPDASQRLGTLSGGQRRRVALARALIEPADLLILDEPTNHLDADTVDWLETMLSRIPAALLLVTHDRYVLDRLAVQTWELQGGALYQYMGGYSRFLEQKIERAAQAASDRTRRTSILRRELAWLRQGPQGRGTKQQARVQRIAALRDTEEPEQERELQISLGTRRLGTRVFELKHVTQRYGDRTLLNDLTLSIGAGDRWGIVGPNGVGKTTLLNLLAGRVAPGSGEVVCGETVQLAYYEQDIGALDESQRVIDYISSAAELVKTSDGQIVSAAEMLDRFLFPPQQQYVPIGTLSGGERRRLYLLRTLMFAPNVLLLDEPSNDLDVQTLATLESYLDQFAGTLVVASHDRYLLDRTVDQLLVFEGDGLIRTFPGSYSAYAAERRQRVSQEPKPQPAGQARRAATERPRTLSFKERKELTALETQIAELETTQARLNADLSAGAAPFAEAQRLGEQLAATSAALEAAVERWAVLAELAEGGA